ncbi:threonine synthase [Amphiplicatus metriothermophilus]|uniref:Threonine synthase n=1 Tax=Amphiplicatus metriothermophilus TaxID=1519374 RepID=A0A239PQ47_9PROT|nr:threonine synthase [Amphiplicatus metriothermophilus]MBB5518670.1 threonine synthase [Amphiplicatus metriothermophilus]SNT72173.1 L-threonine synthase [Amphiplicatus metriothermophilus]
MRYVSTRGEAPAVDFRAALLAALAPDGGLYLPEAWPRHGGDFIDRLKGASFAEAASLTLSPFVAPWLSGEETRAMAAKAYGGFADPAVAPLRRIGEEDWLLELFHGPTLAFKDVAMQLLGLLFERALRDAGGRATIIGATSGDTGGAAVEAFRGRAGVEVFILHPEGRISEVQRRFMTTADDPNICNIAVDGTFDDCQRVVKEIFADCDFCARHSVSGVNSINWARLAIQTVYYFTAIAMLRAEGVEAAPSFVVPTGNFGDVFAGYAAKRMGAPVGRLCVAVNENDIMHRALSRGRYAPRAVTPTISPSMDIQIASNFERLLFEASGRDAAAIRDFMQAFAKKRAGDIPAAWLDEIRADFISERASEAETCEEIARLHKASGVLVDPHTAVGLAAMRKARADGRLSGPVVTLATAHPAKFPDAVESAAGARPPLPAHVGDLFAKPERCERAPASADAVKAMIEQAGGGR